MSQNTRATGMSSGCQGRSWKVFGSGRARTSLSWTRLKPSMAEPSKVMPSSRAFSSSAGVMLKVLAVPRTSVNHSWTKRTARSSTVLSTYSCWLRMSPPLPSPGTGEGRALPPHQCRRRGRGPWTSSYAVYRPATAGKPRRGRLRPAAKGPSAPPRRRGLVTGRASHHHGGATGDSEGPSGPPRSPAEPGDRSRRVQGLAKRQNQRPQTSRFKEDPCSSGPRRRYSAWSRTRASRSWTCDSSTCPALCSTSPSPPMR